jgi:hypothetical protein
VGFTTGSRGKVPGKTYEKRRRNNNNNNNINVYHFTNIVVIYFFAKKMINPILCLPECWL